MTSGREPFSVAKAGYLRFRKVYGGQDAVLLSSTHEQPADGGQSSGPDNEVLRRA
jgi:hypothetical protein